MTFKEIYREMTIVNYVGPYLRVGFDIIERIRKETSVCAAFIKRIYTALIENNHAYRITQILKCTSYMQD